MRLDLLLVQLLLKLHQELVDHAQDDLVVERCEGDRRVQPVTKFRRKQALDLCHFVAGLLGAGKAHAGLLQIGGAGVGGHDDHHVAEIGLATVVVGQRAVIHDLQQDVEDVRVGLLDFVEEQHGVGLLGDGFGEQAALVEADITRWGPDQPGNGMTLHVFRHVETLQLDAQAVGQLLGDLRLADAGRAGKQEGTDRLARVAESGAGHLDCLGECVDRLVLAEDDRLEVAVKVLQRAAVIHRHVLGRDAGDLGDDFLDVGLADHLLLPRLGQDALRGARFVDDVDGLVRQVAIGDVAGRQFHGRGDCGRRILDPVMRLETGLEALEDLDRLCNRGFVDIDFLEAPGEGAVLLEDAAELGVGGRPNALQLTRRERRLEQVRGV